MTRLLACIFVLSGAAGLIYESIWSRYLGLFVGHSAYAQVIVLVIFLGGMSAGAAIAAKRSAKLKEPLIAYAAIEAIVGVIGLVFHDVFGAVSNFAYDSIFPALSAGAVLVTVKWGLAALMILPQSILLGATFPLMSAGVMRRLGSPAAQLRESGKTIGLLYFANSIGAAFGVLLAGFFLLELAGLPGTLLVAAIINLVVALATFGIVRLERDDRANDVADGALPAPEAEPVDAGAALDVMDDREKFALWRLLLAVSFATAVASFIYEIAWIRMLSLVLGSATHAFELMLSAFILGLALGAFWIRRRADSKVDTIRLLGIVQLAMGVAAILTLALYVDAFHSMAYLLDVLDENERAYSVFNLARYGISLAIMLPATFCAGMTLPLITRNLLAAGHGEKAIGSVYAWNTLGSIVGASIAALVLMPLVGLRWMLILGGGLDIALGAWLLWHRAKTVPALARTASLATAAGIAVVLGAVIAPGFDPGIVVSGVFRYGTVPARGARNIVYYEDGRTATVSVQMGSDSGFTIATNGKPDASIRRTWFRELSDTTPREYLRGDESTQVLLALITLAHAPNAREGAVIGHGSGMSSHFLLGSPHLERLATIDIERQMVEAAKVFMPANQRVYEDPRAIFVFDDAKSYFASSDRQYDLILSEPSNPWVSGVSGLFTDEFYQRVSKKLAPNGIFGQWIHLYEIEDALVLSVMRALASNFQSFELFLTNDLDVLVVASNEPQLPRPDWSVFEHPDIAMDLSKFRALSPEVLERTRLITRNEMLPLIGNGDGNSDYYPYLDLHAERSRYMRREAQGFSQLPLERFDVAAAIGERRLGWLNERVPALSHQRVQSLALTARVRSGEQAAVFDTAGISRRLQGARLRLTRVELEMRSGRPPADWTNWFAEVMQVERDRHQGTMGIVDSVFYRDVERYMNAQNAPEEAKAALRFARAAFTYNWAGASREVPALIIARANGRSWLTAPFFVDAGTLARLRSGDVAGARQFFDRFRPSTGRSREDLRVQLIESMLLEAERAIGRGPDQKDRGGSGTGPR
jgi:spermidine synthase